MLCCKTHILFLSKIYLDFFILGNVYCVDKLIVELE